MDTPIFRCPTCGSTSMRPSAEGVLVCVRCGTPYEEVERTCPHCQAVNPPEVEQCQSCGRPLDMLRSVLEARRLTPAERLEKAQQHAAALKDEAEAASQERLRQWWADEEGRRRALAEAEVERDRQERNLLLAAVIFAVVVLVGVLIYALVTSTGPGTPGITPTALP